MPRRPSSSSRLRRARAFIDESFDQPIDLTLMAQEAELSRFHFVRAFREEPRPAGGFAQPNKAAVRKSGSAATTTG